MPTVLSRAEVIRSGMTPDALRAKVASGKWQMFRRGTYITHNGSPTRTELVDAVLLAAGEGATLSHYTAAEVGGLTEVITPSIHVTVPSSRRVKKINGASIHYSKDIAAAGHPTKQPLQTRIEETVLDLADISIKADDAIGWLSAACGRRLTTPERVATALSNRKRARWRRDLTDALTDVMLGNHSVLERRYFRTVERAHGLPEGARQVPHQRGGSQIYDDVRYSEFATVVELDGRFAHPVDGALRDLRRDNVAAARGDVVLHYGWTDVAHSPCAVAIQVGATLQGAGWNGVLRTCGEGCLINGA